MASQSEIVCAIEGRVKSAKTVQYSLWTIGVTENIERTISQHEDENRNIKHLQHWMADSNDAAKNVQLYFLQKEMKRDNGRAKNPIYVYIY